MGVILTILRNGCGALPRPGLPRAAAPRSPEEELKSRVDDVVARLRPVMAKFTEAHCDVAPGVYCSPDVLDAAWSDYLSARDLLEDWRFYLLNQTATGEHLMFAPDIRLKMIKSNRMLTAASALPIATAASEDAGGAGGAAAAFPFKIIYVGIALRTFPVTL